MSEEERLTTPDDPDFAGAEFISQEAMIQYKVANFELHGITWTWLVWSSARDDHDHDHCLICHDAAFSEKYEDDLREGWCSVEPRWETPGWLCPNCFDRFRDHFGWRTAA